ncbi:MAG: Holliday junction branch migration protein RuvA [Desulfovibrio sp.]|nr:Holliday junction branch migration protein RuvA [Desulfovibrio sp.]
MIAFLEGRLDEVYDNVCLVITQAGVGYAVAVPAHTRATLPKRGDMLRLYTSLVVREDALELFGFTTFEERQTFELLVTISKIGAKTALAVLSIFRPQDLERIVADDDPLVLTQVPGIGKKTAQHVFLELKDKLKVLGTTLAAGEASAKGQTLRSVLDGLASLGYAEAESYPVVREILAENPDRDVSEVLKQALKTLSK